MHWYGLIIGIGMAVAISVAERVSKGKLPLWSGLWYMIVPGIVGARMYHAIDQWEYYMTNSNELILIQNGGLGIWGGIIGAILGLVVFAMIRAKNGEEFFVRLNDTLGDADGKVTSINKRGIEITEKDKIISLLVRNRSVGNDNN